MTPTQKIPPQQGTGNFLTGLVFGALAGAAGYFFLKTEDGKSTRKKLSDEWERAKEDLAKSGVIQDATQSLPEAIQHTIQKIIEPKKMAHIKKVTEKEEAQEAEFVEDEVKTPLTTKTKKKVAPKKKTSSTKFKGV